MILKSVGVLSVGKVLGCLYALIGLIVGAFISFFALIGAAASAGANRGGAAALVYGIGAILVVPILYGIGGFIGGIIMALLYNVVASVVGGVEVELMPSARTSP